MALTEYEVVSHGLEIARDLIPIGFAFTLTVRNQIRDRARARGGGKLVDELTGDYLDHGECAHIDHNKRSEDYNDPENGVYTSIQHHLWLHQVDEINGLTPAQNKWAINAIKRRMNGH